MDRRLPPAPARFCISQNKGVNYAGLLYAANPKKNRISPWDALAMLTGSSNVDPTGSGGGPTSSTSTQVVLTNRSDPPDAILREVWQRSGGQRFDRIEDVISSAELQAISDRYKKVAGFDRETLRNRPSFV